MIEKKKKYKLSDFRYQLPKKYKKRVSEARKKFGLR